MSIVGGRILIEHNLLPVGENPINWSDAKSSMEALTSFGFLAELGYNVDFLSASTETVDFIVEHQSTYLEKKGAHVVHAPLFSGFPDNLPETDDHWVRSVENFFSYVLGFEIDLGSGWELSSVPFSGAKLATARLNENTKKSDTFSVVTDLKLVDRETALVEIGESLLSKPVSLREDEKANLVSLLCNGIPLDFSLITYRETFALVASHLWDNQRYVELSTFLNSPVELMRMFAALTETDISLAGQVKYPALNRSQRRLILNWLNNMNLDALWFHRGFWLKALKSFSIDEYAEKYLNVYTTVQKLRSNRYNENSFTSQLERSFKYSDFEAVMNLFNTSPNMFMRSFRRILNVFPEHSTAVFEHLLRESHNMPTNGLCELLDRLNEEYLEERPVVTKQGVVSLQKANFVLDRDIHSEAVAIVKQALINKLETSTKQNVYVNERLCGRVLPLKQRTASVDLLKFERGSKIDETVENNTLRLFLYWIGRDLDLSLIMYDADFEMVGQVSYTNLTEFGIYHSGDITSAPDGASEFIDIPVADLPENVAFLAPKVYNYSGDPFDDLEEAFTGWMIRQNTDKAYDPKTVVNKITLSGKNRAVTPFVYDVKNETFVVVDLPVHSSGWGQSTENDSSARLLSSLLSVSSTKTSMKDLADMFIEANQHVESSKAEADIIIDEKFIIDLLQ